MLKNIKPLHLIGLALLLLVLLPLLAYTINEARTVREREALLQDIYQRQLEAVLYSVNVYAWEVAISISRKAEALTFSPESAFGATAQTFLANNRAIDALVFLRADRSVAAGFGRPGTDSSYGPAVQNALLKTPELLSRLERYRHLDYRKLEPVVAASAGDPAQDQLFLVFSLQPGNRAIAFAAMRINTREFISSVLQPKLSELAGHNLCLEISSNSERLALVPDIGHADISQKKEIWVFPNIYLGIGLQGENIADLATGRTRKNMWLVLALAFLMLLGAWLVFRTIQREVELARIKSDFVSNISHELRTPLALIRMFSETLLLNRVSSEEKRRQYLQTISQESERLTQLVNNILNFSRMEAGRKEYQFARTDLNEVVDEVLSAYRFQLDNGGFELQLGLEENLPAIWADREALQQLLINLLDNALKYSAEEKYVHLQTSSGPDGIRLLVADRGIGIAAQNLHRIYEKFYRVPNDLIHNTKGSGLGLSLVKHIADAHRAQIQVESTPGAGSRFTVQFARLGEEQAAGFASGGDSRDAT